MGIFSTIAARDALFVALEHSFSCNLPFRAALITHCRVRKLSRRLSIRPALARVLTPGGNYHFGRGAVRMEYERIEAYPEYPYMYQLGLTWTF